MSWMQKLYQTYEAILAKGLVDDNEPLTPVGHTLQNAHIVIVLDGAGNFRTARVMLPKTSILLPATEASENRTSGEAPHPLADKIQYVAQDYADYGGGKKAYFSGYFQQLQAWCASPFVHHKVQAVLNYVSKGTVVADLVKAGVLQLDENGKVLKVWTGETEAPEIFAVLPKSKGEIEFGSALVCWCVEVAGDAHSETWTDPAVQKSWADYTNSSEAETGFCLITGTEAAIASMHPAKLRHTGDKAKLISSNDKDGYTFRGRFESAKEAASVSAEVSAKAHSALRWLIARQGIRNGDQVSVAWAVSGQPVPSPLQDTYAYLQDDDDWENDGVVQENENLPEKSHLDWSVNFGQGAVAILKKKWRGYRADLAEHQQISLLMLDSATPGRMALAYYQEFLPADYFANLDAWVDDFAWHQRHTQSTKNGNKTEKRTVWLCLPPSPYAIFETVYGKTSDKEGKIKKQLYARLLPVIAGGQSVPIPYDLVQQSFQAACNPNGYERWEWERNVSVACALYKGWRIRHHQPSERRTYDMALDRENRSRDYLYGRLLAIAENIESYALYLAEEKRTTNAERYMQRFAAQPFTTWRNIELALKPYQERLFNSGRDTGKDAIGEIMDLFQPSDFVCDDKLDGEFLLGYHCQKMELARQIAERKAAKQKKSNPDT